MFKNLMISTRLSAAFAVLTAILLVVVTTAIVQMGNMNAATKEITSNWLPSVELVNRMNTNTSDLRIAELSHVMNTDEKAMAAIEKDMSDTLAAYQKNHDDYVKLISDADERRLYEAFAAEWKQYMALHDTAIAMSRKNENDQAKRLLEGDGRRLFDSASDSLVKLAERNRLGSTAASRNSDDAFAEARMAMAVAAVLAMATAVAAALWLIRSITVPLGRAVAALDRVAAGDLTAQIESSSNDETGQLLAALQRMQASLGRIVGQVRASSDSIATGSAQIATGNVDLSQRTEEQASNLQQTAASMDQISGTVKTSAETAEQASRLASSASASAVKGGQVVGQVVDTMQDIAASSKKIADIIGVIDGIAFQTNILALNAAVEAARAGEQGRGFAVVASEVRSLAGRSAEAAKEIKTLIGASVDKVEAGTRQVNEAGSSMNEIVSQVRSVSQMIEELANAAGQQATGVGQIGAAVQQLDQVTQQNAALVEESAAAAESLKHQAAALAEVVSVFKVTDTEAPGGSTGGKPLTPDAEHSRPRRAVDRARPAPKARVAIKPASTPTPRRVDAVPAAVKAGADDWTSF